MERALREKLPGGKFENVPATHTGRMRAIRSRGNKSTERRLRALLVQAGVRGWKLHPDGLPGKPDFLFPEARLVVFVDGCYWHGCPQCGYAPTVNRPYWSAKIAGNVARDQRNRALLEGAGLRVLRLWEHELAEGGAACVQRVVNALACGHA
jgi:DNA mismatch endonuclease (patch repair protein)